MSTLRDRMRQFENDLYQVVSDIDPISEVFNICCRPNTGQTLSREVYDVFFTEFVDPTLMISYE